MFSRRTLFGFQLLVMIAVWAGVGGAVARSGQPQGAQIPQGPSVKVSDGWYHLDDCSIAVARQAPAIPLADALRKGNGPCPICEPLRHQPDWAAFVATHSAAIKEEVRARAAADAAEAKRRADEAEADRLRRLAELEGDRRRREAAPVPRLTEAQAREAATAALAVAQGDRARFQTHYRAKVRELSPDYAGPQAVYGSATLRIMAAGPVGKFENAIMERLQKKLPTAGVVWSPEVSIAVIPESPDSPDIRQIVVQRSDALRPAGAETVATVLSSSLASRALPGAPLGSKPIHWGEVVFPLSTFEPGSGVTVRVIAVPVSGTNLSRTFTGLALRAFQ